MGLFYEKVIRPVLFTQDPEKAHDLGVMLLSEMSRHRWLCRLLESYNQNTQLDPIELFGLKFPNAVGLAAGMDKNAQFWRAMGALGFGHVEIGTVTHQKQPGNPRPRVFRYPEESAVINRMGFNNEGAKVVAQSLKKSRADCRRHIPLGINIGKSRTVEIEKAAEDYLASFNLLAEYADYFTINVSSPNTPELRKLQGAEYLKTLLQTLVDANQRRASKLGVKKIPILVKIAPDLTFSEVDEVIQVVYDVGLSGIVATNTTIERPGVFATNKEKGGLSGKPLHMRSCEVVNYIYRATSGKLPIIGVGGIMDVAGAARMIDNGASLVQIYTGFIYRGPFFPKTLARSLQSRHSNWY
jgi:dihydroorotate dehydrogenase